MPLLAALSPGVIVFSALSAVVLLATGLRRLATARAMADTPQSRIRSAAQGHVELLGRARWMPGPTIQSPLSGAACVWWHYSIEFAQAGDNDDIVITDETSDDLFYLTDTSGDCIVDPVGARVEPSLMRSWCGSSERPGRVPQPGWDSWFSFGPYRYSEQLIQLDDLLIARGWFRTQAAVADADDSREVAALLGEWKRDRRDLLSRFDANRDGNIDLQEWEAARAAALEQVRAQHCQDAALPDADILSRPPDGSDFLLTATPRQTLIARDLRLGWTLLVLAAVAAIFTLCALQAEGLI
ncbi:MAG: hypothetical protein JWR16_396 [Nevskia sp.]|nr:hypothetical protein [Nevskia sp.]